MQVLETAINFATFEKQLAQINENNFDEIAWALWHFQATHNPVYNRYLSLLGVDIQSLTNWSDVPFLPIECFKSLEIKTGHWPTQTVFRSSGTTQAQRSSHHLWDEQFYQHQTWQTFQGAGFTPPFHLIAFLPNYPPGHSLATMVHYFMHRSGSAYSGFYHSEKDILKILNHLSSDSTPTLLWGVSFALMDLAAMGPFQFPNLKVLETGGMKGRRKEITRAELHTYLRKGLGCGPILSEYGMAELCSQAYSLGEGIFTPAPTMKMLVKEVNDPFAQAKGTGVLNIIDLANFHSCAFIETRDLGRVVSEGFEILGRVDNSEARGCNLLA